VANEKRKTGRKKSESEGERERERETSMLHRKNCGREREEGGAERELTVIYL